MKNNTTWLSLNFNFAESCRQSRGNPIDKLYKFKPKHYVWKLDVLQKVPTTVSSSFTIKDTLLRDALFYKAEMIVATEFKERLGAPNKTITFSYRIVSLLYEINTWDFDFPKGA